jgi:hypothetical protein
MRGDRPWTFTNLKSGDGLSNIIAFLEDKGMLANSFAPSGATRPDGAFAALFYPPPHSPATPALRSGIRFANSSHA